MYIHTYIHMYIYIPESRSLVVSALYTHTRSGQKQGPQGAEVLKIKRVLFLTWQITT